MVTLSGPDVLGRVRAASTMARAASDAAVAAATAARDRLAASTAQRLATLERLASTRLPELNDATAAVAMPEFAAELRETERRRQLRATELQDELQRLEAQRQAAEQLLAGRTADLDAVVARRDELQQQVAERLAADPAYGPLAAEAQVAEVRLARDAARRDELLAEAREKLPAFERSRLFQYLWKRGFGTPGYASRGFVARMDRRLAAYIGYADAAAGYRFLQTTPELVRAEVERRSAEVAELRERVEAVEDEVEAEVGLPAVLQQGAELGALREQAVADVASLQQRLAAVHAALRDEVGSRGAFHRRAVQQLTEFLARAEMATLERRARETPDPADDRLVAELASQSRDLQRAADAVGPLEQEALRLDAIADGLEHVVVRLQRHEFDSARSTFRDLDVDGLLADVRAGRRDSDRAFEELREHHEFREPHRVRHADRTDDVLHGIGLALRVAGSIAGAATRGGRRGGFSSGGGFGGGGGFSSGRGFGGGGGFTSGKGF